MCQRGEAPHVAMFVKWSSPAPHSSAPQEGKSFSSGVGLNQCIEKHLFLVFYKDVVTDKE